MKFFSGFSLENEEELFDFWLDKSQYSVAGFSYGAIKAFEYVYNSKNRVDRLILLSPAFFENRDLAFKKVQLIYFKKNPQKYIDNFLNNINSPKSNIDLSKYIKIDSSKELKELLYYKWDTKKIESILNKGTIIEVILGESDKIINTKEALNFFQKYAITYFIKEANHILRTKDDKYSNYRM